MIVTHQKFAIANQPVSDAAHLALALLLLFASLPVQAEWVQMSENGEADSYIDPDTVRRVGHLRVVSILYDWKTRAPTGVFSHKAVTEFDCELGRQRRVSFVGYAGRMATGEVVVSDDVPGNWMELPSGSTGALVRELVCSRW